MTTRDPAKDPHPGGRPLKFPTPEIMQEAIDSYFVKMDAEDRPYTITGLALHLDCDRDTLLNYQGRSEYFGTIKRAKERVLGWKEERLLTGKGSTVGLIFDLKNNHGWVDKREVEQSGGFSIDAHISFVGGEQDDNQE